MTITPDILAHVRQAAESLLYRFRHHPELDLDDLIQHATVALLATPDAYQANKRTSYATYIQTIARRRILDLLRTARRQKKRENDTALADNGVQLPTFADLNGQQTEDRFCVPGYKIGLSRIDTHLEIDTVTLREMAMSASPLSMASLLTTTETAKLLGVSSDTLARNRKGKALTNLGRIPAFKIGRSFKYSIDDLKSIMSKARIET